MSEKPVVWRYLSTRPGDSRPVYQYNDFGQGEPLYLHPPTAAEPQLQVDSTGAAMVDTAYYWQPIETCPRGVKVQLLGRGNVAVYGVWNGKDDFWTHWAALPKLRKTGGAEGNEAVNQAGNEAPVKGPLDYPRDGA